MVTPTLLTLIAISIFAGVLSSFVGVGGGIIIFGVLMAVVSLKMITSGINTLSNDS